MKKLKEDKREAKRMMRITRPLRGYLGNQFNYWESEFNKVILKINNLEAPKG